MMTSTAYRPEGWEDDDLMRGLMSTFKRREVNPDDYDTKIKFWTQAIEQSCASSFDPVLSEKMLSQRFRRKDRIPAGLETVLRDMWRKGIILTRDEFTAGSSSWLSWGVGMFTRPVSWLLGYSQEPQISDLEFVIPAVIKDQASRVLEKQESYRDHTQDPLPSGVIEYSALRSLQKTMEKLQKEMERMDESIQRFDKEARLYLRQGNKLKAKQVLRQKLLVLKKLREKDDAYSNMLSLMHKLAETKEQKQVLDAYKSGVSAFRQNLSAHGLSPLKVDETMEDIQETLEDQQDIAMALAQGPSVGGGEREAELENELEELLKEDDLDLEPQITKKMRLPDIPGESPEKQIISPPDRLKRLRLQLNS